MWIRIHEKHLINLNRIDDIIFDHSISPTIIFTRFGVDRKEISKITFDNLAEFEVMKELILLKTATPIR